MNNAIRELGTDSEIAEPCDNSDNSIDLVPEEKERERSIS